MKKESTHGPLKNVALVLSCSQNVFVALLCCKIIVFLSLVDSCVFMMLYCCVVAGILSCFMML